MPEKKQDNLSVAIQKIEAIPAIRNLKNKVEVDVNPDVDRQVVVRFDVPSDVEKAVDEEIGDKQGKETNYFFIGNGRGGLTLFVDIGDSNMVSLATEDIDKIIAAIEKDRTPSEKKRHLRLVKSSLIKALKSVVEN